MGRLEPGERKVRQRAPCAVGSYVNDKFLVKGGRRLVVSSAMNRSELSKRRIQ